MNIKTWISVKLTPSKLQYWTSSSYLQDYLSYCESIKPLWKILAMGLLLLSSYWIQYEIYWPNIPPPPYHRTLIHCNKFIWYWNMHLLKWNISHNVWCKIGQIVHIVQYVNYKVFPFLAVNVLTSELDDCIKRSKSQTIFILRKKRHRLI